MARTMKVRVSVDAEEVIRDLQAVAEGADDRIRKVLEEAAEKIASEAPGYLHHQPPWTGSKGKHADPVTYLASAAPGTRPAAYVKSDHPAAPVLEWGGTIPNPGVHRMVASPIERTTAPALSRLSGSPLSPLMGSRIAIPREEPAGKAGRANEQGIADKVERELESLITEHGLAG